MRRIPRAARSRLPLVPALLLAAVSAACAQPGPDAKLPPGAATTGADNTSVGSTARTPNVAYPQAPTATPAAEGADRARPPTEAEKEQQRLR